MKRRPGVSITLLSLSILLSLHLHGEPPGWKQWRGPSRDGNIPGDPWPTSLDEKHLGELWRSELGPGYSGPLVTEKHVYVLETRDKEYEVARALSRETGREIWKLEWKGSLTVPSFARGNGSWIRSTPTLDAGRLYVAGMRDVLVCIDAQEGTELWRLDFMEKTGTPLPLFGFVSSPLVLDDHVYVQAGASFAKLDKRTGEIKWRIPDGGGGMSSAFSSPTIATVGGKRQFLVQSRAELQGVEIETGKVLWGQKVEAFRGMNILTPTAFEDGVFTSSYGGGSVFFKVKREGSDFTASRAWSDGAQGYMSTPVVIDGHAYLHLRNQRMTCFDLRTGKRRWTTTERFGKYMSLVKNGKRILALDERGILYLLHAKPESFEIIDQRQVSDAPCWAHIALRGDEIFIRELNGIRAFRWREPTVRGE